MTNELFIEGSSSGDELQRIWKRKIWKRKEKHAS